MIIGAQFYTLRDHCKNLEDFAESLKKVADIGYTTVQISGTCAYEPQWLRDQLQQNGLQCVLTHSPMEKIRDHTAQVIADHDVFGCDYVGVGAGPKLLAEEGMEQMITIARTAGRQLHEGGKTLMYHNHHMEFNRDTPTGQSRLEYLLGQTAAEELGFTLDTYWVQMGGGDLLDLIGKLRGRIGCVHLKDLLPVSFEEQPRMAPVGGGNLNWERILPAVEAADTRYALVEQDNTYDEDPFACLKKSYDYLTALGLK